MADAAPFPDFPGVSNLSSNSVPQPPPSPLHAISAEGLSAIVKEAVGGVKN